MFTSRDGSVSCSGARREAGEAFQPGACALGSPTATRVLHGPTPIAVHSGRHGQTSRARIRGSDCACGEQHATGLEKVLFSSAWQDDVGCVFADLCLA